MLLITWINIELNLILCNNYREIDLLNGTYKILSCSLLDKIKLLTEDILEDYQNDPGPEA